LLLALSLFCISKNWLCSWVASHPNSRSADQVSHHDPLSQFVWVNMRKVIRNLSGNSYPFA
jgi:hypothetical protein